MESLLTFLLIFMIITAIAAIHMKSLLSSVIALGALGFGAAVAFLVLGAPDVAIPQIVVDIVTLVLLIRATVGRDVKTTHEVRDTFGIAVSVVLLALLIVFAVSVTSALPPLGEAGMSASADAPSHAYLEEGLEKTGASNTVTAVLLDFRGYDTLGEATVLFAALVGAVVLLRKRSLAGPVAGHDEREPGGAAR